MDKQIVFFYPDSRDENIYKHLPIAPIKLGSQLLPEGFAVKIIDGRTDKNYRKNLEAFCENALFLGVSVMTGRPIRQALEASAIAKNANKDLPVVWGGWHPSVLPKETVQHKDIDIVAIGQGERIVVELAKAIRSRIPLKDIRGIAYKDNRGGIIENELMPFTDVNSFKPTDFSLVDTERYIHDTYLGRRTIAWNTSQGCPYSCAFCSTSKVFARRWSGLKAERVLDEISALVDKLGVDGISFVEDNFMIDVDRVRKICEGLLEKGIKVKWAVDMRADQALKLSDEFLGLMKRSGCQKVFLGAESGDQDVLDFINKGITVEATREVARRFYEHDIIVEFLTMVGFPLNPRKDLENTLNLIKEIKSRYPNHQATTVLFTPLPGTDLFDIAVRKGLKKPDSLEGWADWSILNVITPWVDKKYLDTVNRLVKFYIPFAYPSEHLRKMFEDKIFGPVYRLLHKLALFRERRNFFGFPAEWVLIRFLYYQTKVKHNLFKKALSPR